MADLGRDGLVVVFSVSEVVSGRIDEYRLAPPVVGTGLSEKVLWPLCGTTEQSHEHMLRIMSSAFIYNISV